MSGKRKTGGRKNTGGRKGSWERRMSKKIDFLCLAASAVILAVTAALEFRDRRLNGERPLR